MNLIVKYGEWNYAWASHGSVQGRRNGNVALFLLGDSLYSFTPLCWAQWTSMLTFMLRRRDSGGDGVMIFTRTLIFGASMPPDREGGVHLDLPHSALQGVELKSNAMVTTYFHVSLWGRNGRVHRQLKKIWRCESQLKDYFFITQNSSLLCRIGYWQTASGSELWLSSMPPLP